MRSLVILAVVVGGASVACRGGAAAVPELPRPHPPRLQSPAPIDVTARGAGYLTSIALQLQPGWGQFLDDCRLRLAPSHPLNTMALATTAVLVIDRAGKPVSIELVSSGNSDFDRAVRDAIADAGPLPAPPPELLSDDDRVHLRWLFARDRRQAGPATAELVTVELPLAAVVERMLDHGEFARAAHRIETAAVDDAARPDATERVMVAVLREALASVSGVVRRAAVEAIGRARLRALAPDVRRFLAPTIETELRLSAIAAVAALGDDGAAPELLEALHDDLDEPQRLALAETAALVALGRANDAASVLHAATEAATGPTLQTALRALALAPDPTLATKLAAWMATGDARTRNGVCAALPASAAEKAAALIARGLRDPDAAVRATCADAAIRRGHPADRATIELLFELSRDRDRTARARGVAALVQLAPGRVHAADDLAPEVRAAFARAATEPELRLLANDRDADVRAAALLALGNQAGELAITAATDAAPQVRRAAVAAIDDDAALGRLARDDSPEVATAAVVRIAARRGRPAITGPFLEDLVRAPPGSVERVRIALAWLLAS